MARRIRARLKVIGTLVAQSPIHVGGMDGNPQVDLALATNGQGQYYIPGTSLAGAFRGWMQISSNGNNGNKQKIENLWGFQDENGRGGHASFILIEDAPIQGAIAEIRDGVGINRMWGTAAEQVKYDRAILPKGSKIPLDITLDIDSISDDGKTLLAQLLEALENGDIRLGAAKTRGLGKVKLENLSIHEHNLGDRSGILKMLQGQSDRLKLNDILNGDRTLAQTPQITIEIHWQPQSSVMVKAEGDGIVVDILPLVSKIDNHLTFVLPGSSIKGALRTQAERIIRTVCSWQMKGDFMEQLEVPLVEDLFGVRAKANNRSNKGIGSLFIDDCYANAKMQSDVWGNIQAAKTNSDLRQALDNAKLQTTQQAFHVAVDRWTGGAADGFLYSNLELMGVTWQPIRLQLNLTRLRELQLAGIALILLILRDLADNHIPLGYGTNRGMGSIKVTNIMINGCNLDDSLKFLENVILPNGNIAGLNEDEKPLKTLNDAWIDWIEKQKPVKESE
jgi:CRISPR/Cas system CSM-associated protein Csm3 (group 7 of RAMP superfamily)